MKILAWACICPVCREPFTAYLAECEDYQRDEVAHDRRALLCNVCERLFLSQLYSAIAEDVTRDGLLSTLRLRMSALRDEAQRAGEPGHEAQAGIGQPSGIRCDVQGLPLRDRDTMLSHRVSAAMDPAHETLRGPTVLPTDAPE